MTGKPPGTAQEGWRNNPNLSQQEVVTLLNGHPVQRNYLFLRNLARLAAATPTPTAALAGSAAVG